MVSEQHDASRIPVGARVIAADGSHLGIVREGYGHYLLVDQEDEHEDLTIPAHAIISVDADGVRVSINRSSASPVDHEETVHRRVFDDEQPEN